MTSVLSKIDLEPNEPKATDQGREEVPKSRSRTCAEPIIMEERTNVNATQMQGLRGRTGLSNDRLDGKSEEDRAQRVALLHSPRTGNNLRCRHTRASEEDTVVTITASTDWRRGVCGGASDASAATGPLQPKFGHLHRCEAGSVCDPHGRRHVS